MTFITPLLIAAVSFACAIWIGSALSLLRVIRTMPRLAFFDPPAPSKWPRVSMIVPACNEARSIENAVRSRLADDYADIEIVLIDDRSTDETGAMVDELAATDDRITAMHITHLPDGWLGKVHAIDQGVQVARGEWLLLSDADVHIEPGTLRKAVAYCEQRQLDFLAALPEVWPSSLLVDTVISSFGRLFGPLASVKAVENPASRTSVGIGAFNLVRRSAFEKTEGFQWLAMEVIDDVGLGLMMKRSGARCSIVDGVGSVGLHWYRGFGELVRGLEKSYATAGFSLPWSIVTVALAGLLWLAPWAALFGPAWMTGLGGVTLLTMLGSAIAVNIWMKRRVLPAMLFPLGDLLLALIFVRASVLGFMRGGIIWRGTHYPSKALRKGKRTWIGELIGRR